MNYVKFSLGALVAVFFFALGIYFQASVPEATLREPASYGKPEGKLDPKVSQAFKACVDSKIKNDSLPLAKVNIEGRQSSILSIPCAGKEAKELYDALQNHSTEEYVRYRDKRRGVVRFFGRLFPPSQCVELIGGAKGKAGTNDYSCSIRIDVDTEITDKLKL